MIRITNTPLSYISVYLPEEFHRNQSACCVWIRNDVHVPRARKCDGDGKYLATQRDRVNRCKRTWLTMTLTRQRAETVRTVKISSPLRRAVEQKVQKEMKKKKNKKGKKEKNNKIRIKSVRSWADVKISICFHVPADVPKPVLNEWNYIGRNGCKLLGSRLNCYTRRRRPFLWKNLYHPSYTQLGDAISRGHCIFYGILQRDKEEKVDRKLRIEKEQRFEPHDSRKAQFIRKLWKWEIHVFVLNKHGGREWPLDRRTNKHTHTAKCRSSS